MKTEIYATFGPSCREEFVLRRMIEQGMTGMRLNLSHMSLPCAAEYIENYKKASAFHGKEMQILIDMQGPELRLGDMQELELALGECYELEGGNIALPEQVVSTLEAGDELLFDDSKILCKVLCDKRMKVIRGGILKPHKSVKVVGKEIFMPCLTKHDIENIKLAPQYGVTAVMQPFVRSEDDLIHLRRVLDENGAENVKIFAKIESLNGADRIRAILPYTDWIVIARGDLGNDMPLWDLPRVQKYIEDICNECGVPYIVVTQMLASMEHSPVPTRAEVSDIFHAVYNGASGVMITGESAVGKYPVEAVEYLSKTSKEAENEKRTC